MSSTLLVALPFHLAQRETAMAIGTIAFTLAEPVQLVRRGANFLVLFNAPIESSVAHL
jgi:hypothetical protein